MSSGFRISGTGLVGQMRGRSAPGLGELERPRVSGARAPRPWVGTVLSPSPGAVVADWGPPPVPESIASAEWTRSIRSLSSIKLESSAASSEPDSSSSRSCGYCATCANTSITIFACPFCRKCNPSSGVPAWYKTITHSLLVWVN